MAITVSDVYIRPADTNDPFGYIEQIRGGWITVADSASMAAIPFERAKDGQIAYLQDEKVFYIATKVAASQTFDPGPPPSVVQIPASLTWAQLPFSGSFSGSFQGDGSGLTGVGGVPGGTVTQLQFHSASGEDSVFGGAELYYISSSGNLGIGVTNPSVKLHVDGDAIVTGTLTAQEFHTEFVSASIIYQSGSTKFGDTSDDNHAFTGSVNISGSLQVTGTVEASELSGSFSGSFQGDGSNLTGIASTLTLSGSTGNDLVNLKTDALTITGSARNIDVAVTDNQVEISVPDDLQLTNVELTGSFNGTFSGSFIGTVDAVITNAVTASYVLNAVSASYAHTASYSFTAVSASYAVTSSHATTALTASYALTAGNAISASYALTASYSSTSVSASYAATAANATSASYAATASYVAGYAQGSGVASEVTYWKDSSTVSGSQAFFISESYSGNLSVFVDGKVYSQNDGGLVSLGTADISGSKAEVGVYNDTGGGKGVLYAGSSSGVTTGAIQIANSQLMNAYAIGTSITPNAANTLRIQPTIEVINGASGSFSGSFYGRFIGLIDSASYAAYAVTADTASYVLNAISASYAATASYVLNAVSASYAATASYSFTAVSASYTLTSTSASHALFANNATSASHAILADTASYFTGSYVDFTPLATAPAYKNGRLWYSSEDGALTFYNEEADISLQIGQEFYTRVYNATTSSIANGTPVFASGSQGDRIKVYPAFAENHTAGAHYDNHILGLATHTIEASTEGYVTRQGIVRGINTSGFSAGDVLYLQTGSAGLRNTPPPFPYDIVQVGYVARSASPNGFVFVEPKEPVHFSNISGLSGSAAPSNKDLWVFNSANNGWYNTHSGLELSGSFSGSFSGTVDRAISSSHAVQADNALTSVTASYALKAESVGTLNQDVTILGDLTVFGSSSFYHVTSSQLDVDSAFISVNVFEPAERFGGLKVYDSGSTSHLATASLAWDSLHNHWVYQNSSGSTYSGGMFLSGPRNTGSLGDEPGLTKWYVARSDGGDHLNDTQIYSSASTHIAYGDLFTTGTTSGSFVGDGSGLFGVAANPAGVDKSIQFKSGSLTGGASNFFYDHTAARVGIGTASPTSILDVNGVIDSKGYSVNGNYADFASLPDAGVYGANISFDDGFGALLIASRTDATRAIAFGTNNGTAMGERMRIKGDGNVGIGTTNPNAKLNVVGNTVVTGSVMINATTGGKFEFWDVGVQRAYISMTGTPGLNLASDAEIQFQPGNSTAVTFASGGNVGIGTTNPTKGKLQILKTSATNHIALDGGSTNNVYMGNFLGQLYLSTNYYYQGGQFQDTGSLRSMEMNMGTDFIAFNSMPAGSPGSRTQVMYISGSQGRVGVGTTSPVEKLDVNGNIKLPSTSGNGVFFVAGSAPSGLSWYSQPGTADGPQLISYGSAHVIIDSDNNDADTRFFTIRKNGTSYASSTELLRVTEAGNLGIGTTAPSEKLHVAGNIKAATLQVYDGLGAGVTGVGAASAAGALRLYASGALGVTVNTTRAVQFNGYGSGTQTGTATKSLAVDSSGNVIEIDVSSNGTGVANEVAVWKDTDTVSGSQDFTWDGTTLSINGILEANEKSFVIDHPTQPGKKLVYGVLEGPEHAVYCRGKINGNVIELPEEWTGLVDQDSITVQLTSIGKHQNLYVADIRDNKVFIKNGDLLTSKINAYYYIQGTRKDTKPLQTVRDK